MYRKELATKNVVNLELRIQRAHIQIQFCFVQKDILCTKNVMLTVVVKQKYKQFQSEK